MLKLTAREHAIAVLGITSAGVEMRKIDNPLTQGIADELEALAQKLTDQAGLAELRELTKILEQAYAS